VIPRCSFCERLAATPKSSHITVVWSRPAEKYVPCCIPCLKRRKDKLVVLVRIPGIGGDPKLA